MLIAALLRAPSRGASSAPTRSRICLLIGARFGSLRHAVRSRATRIRWKVEVGH